MIKKYLKTLVVTSLAILVPVLAGLLLWNRLPESIPTHFNLDGDVDGWTGRGFFILLMPVTLLAVHWFTVLCIALDKKTRDMSDKLLTVILWIVPVITLMIYACSFAIVLGYQVNVVFITMLVMGLGMMILGNFMGKAKYNYVIGIRLPTTLNDEDNWFHTHRLAGWTFTLAGLFVVATSFLSHFTLYILAAAASVVIPMVYSFIYALCHNTKEPDA